MRRADLTEFEIEDQGFKLRIRRNSGSPMIPVEPKVPEKSLSTGGGPSLIPPPPPSGHTENGIHYIKSPMVGTFYRAPSPESPPYINPGDNVTENTVVCIIEAMKVMNEIQAEIRGKVLEVLVENGKSVEYGQPLFKIKTAS